jgi:hypothetical protein
MGRLRGRLARLERRGLADDTEEEQGLTMAQRHYRRAFQRATLEEQETLTRLLEGGEEDRPRALELWEKVLRREASTLADDVRVERDLLHQELDRLEEDMRGRGVVMGWDLSLLSIARVNRRTVIHRGAEPIEDEEEAHSIVEEITAATSVEQVLELIGWR